MAARLAPSGHYNLNGGTLVGNALHDLNTVDSRNPDIDAITDTERDAPTGDELDNDEDSTSGGVSLLMGISRCCVPLPVALEFVDFSFLARRSQFSRGDHNALLKSNSCGLPLLS